MTYKEKAFLPKKSSCKELSGTQWDTCATVLMFSTFHRTITKIAKSRSCFFCAGFSCRPRTHPAHSYPRTFAPLPEISFSPSSFWLTPLPLCQCHLARETAPVHPMQNCSHPQYFLSLFCFPVLHTSHSVFYAFVFCLHTPLLKVQESRLCFVP